MRSSTSSGVSSIRQTPATGGLAKTVVPVPSGVAAAAVMAGDATGGPRHAPSVASAAVLDLDRVLQLATEQLTAQPVAA